MIDRPPEVIDWLKKAFGKVTIDFYSTGGQVRKLIFVVFLLLVESAGSSSNALLSGENRDDCRGDHNGGSL